MFSFYYSRKFEKIFEVQALQNSNNVVFHIIGTFNALKI